MKRKNVLVIAVLSLVVVAVIAAGAFMFIQRTSGGSASNFRPGMMMHNSGKYASGPSRLIAVSPQGTPVALPEGSNLPNGAAEQTVGGLKVKLSLSPYPPVSFNRNDFTVTLTDEKGQPVTDAAISLDLTMPEMPMPTNIVTLNHSADGVYQAPGRFTMRGWWRVEVRIERGGQKQSAFFDLGL